MVLLGPMCFKSNNQITKTLTITQLAEHHCKQLVPTGEVLHIPVAVIVVRYPEEHILVDEVQQLREHVFPFVHIAVVCLDGKDKFKSARLKKPCNSLTYSNFKELF
jgi:hypothetical protein